MDTDLSQTHAEIKRVLKPGGLFLFIEHVAAHGIFPNLLPDWWASRSTKVFQFCVLFLLMEFLLQMALFSDSCKKFLIHSSSSLQMGVAWTGKQGS